MCMSPWEWEFTIPLANGVKWNTFPCVLQMQKKKKKQRTKHYMQLCSTCILQTVDVCSVLLYCAWQLISDIMIVVLT